MKNKMQSLTVIVKEMGLSPQEIVNYWAENGMLPQSIQISPLEEDVRTKAKLYWYFFANGEFSADANAYKGCIGVVGWINPDKNAPIGNRVYIVLRKQISCIFSSVNSTLKTTNEYDGYNNTQLILQHSRENKISFPAVSYCDDICKLRNFQKPFLPAKEQAICLAKNSHGIKNALAKVGGTFEGSIWTSSIFIPNNIWVVQTKYGEADVRNRALKANVTAIMAL